MCARCRGDGSRTGRATDDDAARGVRDRWTGCIHVTTREEGHDISIDVCVTLCRAGWLDSVPRAGVETRLRIGSEVLERCLVCVRSPLCHTETESETIHIHIPVAVR